MFARRMLRRGTLRRSTKTTVIPLAVAALIGSVVVAASPASAATFDGVLGIHGAGTVYAGTDASGLENGAVVSLSTAPGGTAKFAVEVRNIGSQLSQYEVNMVSTDGQSADHLFAGSVDVSPLAAHPENGGFVTSPIAPGKAQLLTLKITPPAGSTPDSAPSDVELDLWSVGEGQYLGSVWAYVSIKATTGSTDHDLFGSASGETAVRGSDTSTQTLGAPTLKPNKTATYNLVLKNDSATSSQIRFGLSEGQACSPASWLTTAKIGTANVTSQVFAGTYVTPMLSPGSSVKIVFTVQSVLPHPDESFCPNYEYWVAEANTVNGFSIIYVVADAIS